AWGSRATAIRARPTRCTTTPPGACVTCGSTTTSRRRAGASAPPACRTSSPRDWSGGNDASAPVVATVVRGGRVSEARPSRVSTLEHWESYWKGHGDLDRTYSTGGRLVREILRDGDVRGRRVMEVGAGSGRYLLDLAERGGIGIVLDYSPA